MLDPYNDHEGSGHPDSIMYIKSMKSNLSLAFLSEGGTHVGAGGGGSFREFSKEIFKAISGEVTPMTPKCKKISTHWIVQLISLKCICCTVIYPVTIQS